MKLNSRNVRAFQFNNYIKELFK